MNSVSIEELIKNIKFVESSIPMGPALNKILTVWKDSFTDGELFILSRLKPANQKEFKLISSQINNFQPVESALFDHFFQNTNLKQTSLKLLGIDQDIRIKPTINKIPSLSLNGYFAHACRYSGQYWSKELPNSLEAKELGQLLFKELYEERYSDLTCFFANQSWSESYPDPQAFLNFIIFDEKNSQIDFILALTQF